MSKKPAYWSPLRSTAHHQARAYRDSTDWLASLKLRGRSDRTLDDYERTIAALLVWLDKPANEYTTSDLEHFVLLHYGATAGARVRISHLRSFFGWLHKRERIDKNPSALLEPPQPKRQSVIDVFTEPEIALLTGLPSPDGYLCTILLFTGIRKTEARKLQRKHIVLDPVDYEPLSDEPRHHAFKLPVGGHLVIYEGKGNKDRIVPFTSTVALAVAELDFLERLNPEDHLWSSRPGGGDVIRRRDPVSNTAMQRWWADEMVGVCARAGVRHRKLHTTRHTYANRLIRRGARIENVQKLLGHASIQTTIDEYGHLTVEDARNDLLLLEEAIV